jgi:hypothetical protein
LHKCAISWYNKKVQEIIMNSLKEFYNRLSAKKKIVLWVSLFFILFSIVRIIVWQAGGGTPGPRDYVKKLASDSPEVKKFAIYEVGRLKLDSAVSPLIKILKEDADPSMKRAAATSLGKINIEQLVALLCETDKNIKYTVMEILIRLDRTNVSYLMERFPEEDTETKIEMLSYVDSTSGIENKDTLLGITEDTKEDVQVRATALQMLGKYDIDADTESRLWNLYYNDPEDRIKEIAYRLVKGEEEK